MLASRPNMVRFYCCPWQLLCGRSLADHNPTVRLATEADDAKARPAASLSPTGASAALQFGADGSVKMSKVMDAAECHELHDRLCSSARRANILGEGISTGRRHPCRGGQVCSSTLFR